LNYYDPGVLATDLQLPKNLDPRIAAFSRQLTAGSSTMYDKVVALENYLRTSFKYDVNVHFPPGQEGVSWFLFQSDHRGFCNYFATSMAIMARSLGIPARMVSGYTNGQLDAKHHDQVIHGTEAHSWTQIYFAGYGWINFEPSAGFSDFVRPISGQFQSGISNNVPGGGINALNNAKNRKVGANEPAGINETGTAQTPAQFDAQLRQQAGIAVGSLVLLILFSFILFGIWWRRLFRNHPISAQIYGRISVLANWAGIPLQRSQTPYEYMQTLAIATPEEAATLERFGDIYVRQVWADPDSPEHPLHSGEVEELPGIWKRLQPRLFRYMLRHPHILSVLPRRIWKFLAGLRAHRRARRAFEQDL
jgi:hypothetical protein